MYSVCETLSSCISDAGRSSFIFPPSGRQTPSPASSCSISLLETLLKYPRRGTMEMGAGGGLPDAATPLLLFRMPLLLL